MQRRFSLPSVTAIAVLAAALLATVLMVPVLAGTTPALPGDDPNRQVPEFEYDDGFVLTCPEEEIVYEVQRTDLSGPIDTLIEPEELGDGAVRFRVPSLPGGNYYFERSCPAGEAEEGRTERRFFSHSRVVLTKTIDGDVPADSTFTVNVACTMDNEPLFPPENREFTADGGKAQVVLYQADDSLECDVTETDTGGADGTTIKLERDPLTFAEYSDGFATITNTFPTAQQTQAPEPEPEPSPTPEVDNTVEEAEPAEPVEAEPTFTG